MRKNLKLFPIIYVLGTSYLYAASLEIKNETDSPIKIFIREHGREKSYPTDIVGAHQDTVIQVDKTFLGLEKEQFYYDIIASDALESTIEPEWRLLAGECDNLFSADDRTIVIQTVAGGLKTNCRVIKKK
jgi:hypothetical protein